MEEPFDAGSARGYIQAILDGPGMTVFSKRLKDDLTEHGMTALDAVNVVRGGVIAAAVKTPAGWRYRAKTQRMTVEFSFRGQGHAGLAAPDELVLESARRNHR